MVVLPTCGHTRRYEIVPNIHEQIFAQHEDDNHWLAFHFRVFLAQVSLATRNGFLKPGSGGIKYKIYVYDTKLTIHSTYHKKILTTPPAATQLAKVSLTNPPLVSPEKRALPDQRNRIDPITNVNGNPVIS